MERGTQTGTIGGSGDVLAAGLGDNAAVDTLAEWWSAGEHLMLALGGVERSIFVRRLGKGPPMTLLHGFPSSSHDWAKVAPALAERHALLMPDLLGFGASARIAPSPRPVSR